MSAVVEYEVIDSQKAEIGDEFQFGGKMVAVSGQPLDNEKWNPITNEINRNAVRYYLMPCRRRKLLEIMKTSLIKLNELRIEGEEYVMKSCLVNTDKIVSVQSGKLSKKGPHLIGQERERELRMISLAGAPAIFVNETVEELYAIFEKT